MDTSAALEPVLRTARDHAADVDAEGRFPTEAVTALRDSGLLGLTLPLDAGGLGGGPADLVRVAGGLAAACGSTAMVYLMHVSAAMTVAAAPPPAQPKLLGQMASGEALGTLAFSEPGSRSHFWAPTSVASADGDTVTLASKKSFVTSAGHADVYVVSTQSPPGRAEGVDLYAVPADADGIAVAGPWKGLGLRGNASSPMTFALDTDAGHRIGAAGGGFGLMLETVLPWFNLGNAAVSLGLAQAAVDAAVGHASGARLEHLGESLAQLPTIRAHLSKTSIELAAAQAYLDATARSLAAPDEGTMLRVLAVKALANDTALHVTDAAMRVCGGAAFAKGLGLERYFRDARAGHVMAPTADVLYDFYGKAVCGLPLFES
ncbi:acyl-CoA/acyl-ACP dehydrogenase [Glycomyces sp. TRM65418]|uniref:Rv1679 family acyl-CoA dehydrogenase n=1 Tax=Glycomyces sp. TRM65418 TaxID=2867006 RepID=UPI001CE53951|nr:acyl-CoA dehydrogenase family protein [Glycomyces sp. TRM65418]MCC3761957.1 acyl-CoA/acyl-ACP dehydrogenase [Glycomyces sp. TRM65418]QZD56035.1 acyl-CoA/acyl-ACP dehydrogenase [Glycomyces sp. TRM65418]